MTENHLFVLTMVSYAITIAVVLMSQPKWASKNTCNSETNKSQSMQSQPRYACHDEMQR